MKSYLFSAENRQIAHIRVNAVTLEEALKKLRDFDIEKEEWAEDDYDTLNAILDSVEELK